MDTNSYFPPGEQPPMLSDASVSPARRAASAAIYEMKSIIAEHPTVAIPLARLRGHGEMIDERTEIVVEAFPRSAQSFAVAAFRLAQEPRVSYIAHHTHSPSTLIAGIRRGVPALLIVRRPEDAILSYVVSTPSTPVPSAIRGYVRFLRPLLGYRADLVVGTFEQVTENLGSVIERVNRRFGTKFSPFDPTEGNVSRIYGEIDEDWRARGRDEEERERRVPRPSPIRDELKTRQCRAYRDPRHRALAERAERLYRAFAGLALT